MFDRGNINIVNAGQMVSSHLVILLRITLLLFYKYIKEVTTNNLYKQKLKNMRFEMNYIKIYYDIVNKAKLRGLDKKKLDGYFEEHHIVPACYFKSRKVASYKENLVLLTGEEHILCHHLLWKNDNSSLMYAYHTMVYQKNEFQKRDIKLTPKQFEILRSTMSLNCSKRFKGKFLTEIHKKHIGESYNVSTESINNMRLKLLGKIYRCAKDAYDDLKPSIGYGGFCQKIRSKTNKTKDYFYI